MVNRITNPSSNSTQKMTAKIILTTRHNGIKGAVLQNVFGHINMLIKAPSFERIMPELRLVALAQVDPFQVENYFGCFLVRN